VYRGVEPKGQTQITFTGDFADDRVERHALRSLAEVLELRLRDRLREDLGGTYRVGVRQSSSREERRYALSIAFGADPERLADLSAVVFEEIARLKALGPSDLEVTKVRESQRRGRETSLRNNGYWARQLIAAAQYGVEPRDILAYESLIEALDVAAVRAAAARYLPADNYVQVTLYPESRPPGARP